MAIIAAPEGLKRLHEAHPDVQIYVGHVDRCLNETLTSAQVWEMRGSDFWYEINTIAFTKIALPSSGLSDFPFYLYLKFRSQIAIA